VSEDEKAEPVEVVVITNDPKVFNATLPYLTLHGYKVSIYINFNEALAKVQESQPDAVLLSWNLKNMNPVKCYNFFTTHLKVLCLVFVEDKSPMSTSSLMRSRIPNTLFPPIGGPSIHRRLKFLLGDKGKGEENKDKDKKAKLRVGRSSAFGAVRVKATEISADTRWERVGEISEVISSPEQSDPAWKGIAPAKNNMNNIYYFKGESKPEFDVVESKWKNLDEKSLIIMKQQKAATTISEVKKSIEIDKKIFSLIQKAQNSKEFVFREEKPTSKTGDAGLLMLDKDDPNDPTSAAGAQGGEKSNLIYNPSGKKKGSGIYYNPSAKEGDDDLQYDPSAKGEAEGLHYDPSEKGDGSDLQYNPSGKSGNKGIHYDPSGKGEAEGLHYDPSGKGDAEGLHYDPSAKGDGSDLAYDPSGKSGSSGIHYSPSEQADQEDGPDARVMQGGVAHAETSEHSSLLARCVKEVLAEYADATKASQEIKEVSKLIALTIHTVRFKGYLLLSNLSGTLDDKFAAEFLTKLKAKLETKGERLRNADEVLSVNVKQFPFEEWSRNNADFMITETIKGEPAGFAYIPVDILPDFTPQENYLGANAENWLRVNMELSFDLHLHLPKNNKYFLYVKKGTLLSEATVKKFLQFNVSNIFINPDEKQSFLAYCVRNILVHPE
jgi:hypothetical protein